MQQRLHFFTSEVQHGIQVINYTVYNTHTRTHILRLDMLELLAHIRSGMEKQVKSNSKQQI